MTSIEKIRQYIKKRKKELDEQIVDIYDSKAVLRKDELQKFLSFLDTLSEEPELVRHPPIAYTYPSDASRDERLKMALLALLNSDLIKVAGNKFTKLDLIDWVEKQNEQKCKYQNGFVSSDGSFYPVWSEEDEKMRVNILNALTPQLVYSVGKGTYTGTSTYKYDDEIKWLKSLRPQPKAELTLLDKNIIEAAVASVKQNDHFNCWGGIDKHTVIKALYSLKHHWKPSEVCYGAKGDPDPVGVWKPSEEQMEALEYVIRDYREDSCNATANYLQEILDHLKNM